MALRNGKSYWCSALGKVGAIERLVKQLAPAGSDTNDPKVIKQAFKAAESRLRSGWKEPPEVHFSSDNQRRRVIGKEYTIQENLEGEEVTVWPTGRLFSGNEVTFSDVPAFPQKGNTSSRPYGYLFSFKILLNCVFFANHPPSLIVR